MATLTINGITPRITDGYAKRYNYSPFLEDGITPNPETKSAFAKRKLIEHVKQAVREAEIQDAVNAAATTAGASVDSEIVMT